LGGRAEQGNTPIIKRYLARFADGLFLKEKKFSLPPGGENVLHISTATQIATAMTPPFDGKVPKC
jgi:hypothetical protein